MISRHGPFTVYKICIRETLEKVIEAEREKKIMYEDMLAKVTERLESVEKKL